MQTISFHIDFLGLIRLGSTNEKRLDSFLSFLKNLDAKVLIPVFSYDLTDDKIFDKSNSKSKVGFVTEWLRKTGEFKRTSDGIFSYLTLGDFQKKHFEAIEFVESFGESGILNEFYEDNGEIASIGGVWRHATEIHFLEKKLGVKYRFDKDFSGEMIDENGTIYKHTVRYFCRDISLNLRPCFRRLEHDLKNEGILIGEEIKGLYIEKAKIKDVEDFLRCKLAKDPHYLCVEMDKWIP